MVALRPAIVLVAGLAVISTAVGASFSRDSSRPTDRDDTSASTALADRAAEPGVRRKTPDLPQLAQAEPSKAAGEDEAFRAMTSDAVEAVRNFGKPKNQEEILTANVVDAIRDLDRATDPNAPASARDVEDAAQNLRNAIREIVKHADKRGEPEDYVLKLIEEAVATSGSEVPVALLAADGNLDTTMLVRSVVGRSLDPAEADADAGYLAALRGEAGTTAGKEIDSRVRTAAKPVPAKIRPSPKARPSSVIVVNGDTLGGIAWRYYGDALAYVKIFEANKDRLESPDQIRVGATLRLP